MDDVNRSADPRRSDGGTPVLTQMVEADLDEVLDLNQRSVPHVSGIDLDRLRHIVGQCTLALIGRTTDSGDAPGLLAGFVLVLPPGADYDSPNYGFFTQAYGDFRYVDRIAVEPEVHRSGLGRQLYRAVFDHARDVGAPVVTAEVNIEPPNPVSQEFHQRLGFVEVGRQDNYGGTVTVQMLARQI